MPSSTLTSPENLPTLHPPHTEGFKASDCLVDQQLLPYVCGVAPGETTRHEVFRLIGEPSETYSDTHCSFFLAPNRSDVDSCWDCADYARVFFDKKTVEGINVWLNADELTLGEAVETLGPPVSVILYHEESSSPPEWEQARRANGALFLWPDTGIYLRTGLYSTQGVGLDADEATPLFPANLSIDILVAFEPCSLEELEDYFRELYPPGPWIRWIDWPGMID